METFCDCGRCNANYQVKSLRDVPCCRCKRLFHREFIDNNHQGLDCDSQICCRSRKEGSLEPLTYQEMLETEDPVYIFSSYGSSFDSSGFVFGRDKPTPLGKCPDWCKETFKQKITGPENQVCDDCIRVLLREGTIKYNGQCELDDDDDVPCFPAICENCNKVIEDGEESRWFSSWYYKEGSNDNNKIFVYKDEDDHWSRDTFFWEYAKYELVGEKVAHLKDRVGSRLCNACGDPFMKDGSLVLIQEDRTPDEPISDSEYLPDDEPAIDQDQ